MRLKFLILIALSVVNGFPGNYRSSYSFQRSSSSTVNNELQHKTNEAGSYAKEGSTDGDEPPKVQTSYAVNEYKKPESELTDETSPQSQIGWSGMDMGFPGFGGIPQTSYGGSSNYGRVQSSYGSSSNYRTSQSSVSSSGDYRRPITPKEPGAGKLEEIDDSQSIDYSKYQTHGFGKDYLEETEGHTRRPANQEGTNIIHKPIRQPERPGYGSHSIYQITPVIPQTGHHAHKEEDIEQSKEEGLTQQSQVGFGDEFGSHTDQSQVDYGKLEIGSQTKPKENVPKPQTGHGNYGLQSGKHFEAEEMHQQSHGYGKLEFGSHHDQDQDDLTQQSQVGFGDEFGSHTDQSQVGFGNLESGSHLKPKDTPKPQGSYGTQPGNSPSGFGSHTKPWETTPKPQVGLGSHRTPGKHYEESQTGYGKLEFGSQTQGKVTGVEVSEKDYWGFKDQEEDKDFTQQSQVGFEHEFGTHTDQSQVGFGNIEVGSQTKPKETTPQPGKPYGTQEMGQGTPVYGNQRVPHSPSGVGSLEFGSQTNPKETTPQSGNPYGTHELGHGRPVYGNQRVPPKDGTYSSSDAEKLEFGSHQTDQKDFTQQSQVGFGDEFVSHTDQSQVGFGNIDIGSQTKPKDTTPTQTSHGTFKTEAEYLEFIKKLLELQGGTGKLEFGSHTSETTPQKPSPTQFGTNKEPMEVDKDLTQQSQVGFDEFGTHTDQTQEGFGKFEFGSHGKPKETSPKPLGHGNYGPQFGVTQTGHGTLEFGSHTHGTNPQKPYQPTQIGTQREPMEEDEHLTQQSQVGFEEFGSHTDQSQVGFGNLEYGSQTKPKETTPQTTTHGSYGAQSGKHYEVHEMHHSQSSYGKMEFGSHRGEDKNVSPHEGKLELGSDEEDLTQQSQVGFEQSQVGFGNLEFGSQAKPKEVSPKPQVGLGNYGTQSGKHFEAHEMHRESLTGYGNLEFGSQGQEKAENQQGGFTQQTQTGGKKFFWTDASRPNSRGVGQDGLTQQSNRGYDSSSSYGSYSSQRGQGSSYGSSRQYSSRDSSNYGSAPIKPIYEQNLEGSDEQMKVIEDIAKYAQTVNQEGNTQQKEDLQAPIHEPEFEKMEHFKPEHGLEGIPAIIEEVTTKKPGFWRRLGTSITSTYENAKEKTKHVVEKVKHNLG